MEGAEANVTEAEGEAAADDGRGGKTLPPTEAEEEDRPPEVPKSMVQIVDHPKQTEGEEAV